MVALGAAVTNNRLIHPESYDSVEFDMILFTPLDDPAQFHLKRGIFELLWTNQRSLMYIPSTGVIRDEF